MVPVLKGPFGPRVTSLFPVPFRDRNRPLQRKPGTAGCDWDGLDFEMLRGDRKVAGLGQGWMTLDGTPENAPGSRTDPDRSDQFGSSSYFDYRIRGRSSFPGILPDLSFSEVQARSDQCQWRFPTVSLMVLNPETRFNARILDKGRQIRIGAVSLQTKNWGDPRRSFAF